MKDSSEASAKTCCYMKASNVLHLFLCECMKDSSEASAKTCCFLKLTHNSSEIFRFRSSLTYNRQVE